MTLKYNKFKCYWAVVTEKKTANRLFSLPWNYPNKWTVPLILWKVSKGTIQSFENHATFFWIQYEPENCGIGGH